MRTTSKEIYSNLLWRIFERVGAQGVTLIVSLVLARILDPEVFGKVALITVFTAILQVFVDSGLGNSLIQKKDADDLDFSSVFYFNMAVCLFLYFLMYIAAPYIAGFYNDYSLTPMIRVMSISIIISGVKNIQQAYVSKTMQFKKFFFSTLGGTIGAGIIGIVLALHGYGVWAVILQNIFNMLVDTIILWITVKWRPKRMFSWQRLIRLLSFGSKLLAVSLINNIYNEIRQLLIGKIYSADNLAFYNQGNRFPQFIVQNINTAIDNVVFSAMSLSQDRLQRVKEMTRRSIATGSFIIAPLMIGLAAVTTPLVKLLLSEKWLPCVPYLQIFAISYLFMPIQTANLNAIKAIGRSDIYLKLDIVKIIFGIIVLIITYRFGPLYIALGFFVSSIFGTIINAAPNAKLLNYKYTDQMKDLLPNVFSSLIMAVIVYPLGFVELTPLVVLFLQVIIGAIVYLAISFFSKNESLRYCITVSKEFMGNRSR